MVQAEPLSKEIQLVLQTEIKGLLNKSWVSKQDKQTFYVNTQGLSMGIYWSMKKNWSQKLFLQYIDTHL